MAGDESDITSWVLGIGATVVTTLVGTVVTLTKYIEGKYRKEVSDLSQRLSTAETESAECKKDREEIRITCARYEAKLESLACEVAGLKQRER